MKFFRLADFKEIMGFLTSSSDDVIVESIFSVYPSCGQGPSFIVEGSYDDCDPVQILDKIAAKAGTNQEQLSSMNAFAVESLMLMPEKVKNWKIARGNSVFSFYNCYYPKDEIGFEEITATPFYADGVLDRFPRNISAIHWDTWMITPCWLFDYDVVHDDVPNLSRTERFRIEDAFFYVNNYGGISLQRNATGDLSFNAKDDIIAESRDAGARDGYYETSNLFYRTLENDVEKQERLRKELHVVLPTFRILYYTDPDTSGKPFIVRVFKYDETRLLVLFQFCPNLIQKENDSKPEEDSGDVTENRIGKQSFFKRLFNKN